MSDRLPEKRVRHRSRRDEITVERIARTIYHRNPDMLPRVPGNLTDRILPAREVHWTAARYNGSQKWLSAHRAALDIYAMFQPYTIMHAWRAEPMFEKCLRNGITEHSLEDIDRAIQSEIESMTDEEGHYISIDSDRNWSEIEGRVLMHLDINEGHYWAAEIG